MKKKSLLFCILPLAILILELLPFGAVLQFFNPETGSTLRYTYSYFSLTPYGYANFGPFLTALCTVCLLLLSFVGAHRPWRAMWEVLCGVAAVGTVTSLLPLMLGASYVTPIGVAISVLFVVEFGVLHGFGLLLSRR